MSLLEKRKSSPRRVLLIGVLLGSWLGVSCARPRPAIRNVLLISIDTLRADHLSSYGFPRRTTPNIDAVAREGVLFENAYSPVPATLPAHSSMLTGTLPPFHGLRDNLHERLSDSSLTLAELLKAKGLATAAVVSSFVLDRRFKLDQGFDSYDDRFEAVHKVGDLSERKGDETTARATAWLTAHASQPFFLFVHYYDPHDPYEPPEPYASQWAGDLYSGEVAFADRALGQVLERLKELRLYDETLIVITSDHGEMLGEHGELTHGFFVYEGALKVPLVFKVPGAKTAPRRVEQVVSLIDIVPTVAALLGVPAPQQSQGLDLSPLLSGGSGVPGRPLYAETITPARYYGAGSLLAVIVDGWKYIETTRPELYDLRRDPGETVNLVHERESRADVLGKELKHLVTTAVQAARPAEAAVLDEDARQRLAALGYLNRGASGPELSFDRSKEDPKDLIAFFRSDQRLSKLVDDKKYAEAKALCETMLRQRPGFADCHLQMSRIAAKQGNLAAALLAARKAAELSPDSEPARLQLAGLALAHFNLGRTAKQQGQLDEAVREYRLALAIDPRLAAAHNSLGSILGSQGRVSEATQHFREAVRVEPNNAEAHNNLGLALRLTGKADEALVQLRAALTLRSDWTAPMSEIAWTLATHPDPKLRDPAEAVRLAERAAELTGRRDPVVLDTLAAAYAGAGDWPRAATTAEAALALAAGRPRNVTDEIGQRLALYRRKQPYREPAGVPAR